MKKVYFIRHGETVMNAAGIISGQCNTPLNETGKQQALESAKVLHQKVGHIDYIVTSTLDRAYDTAKIIAEEIDFNIEAIERNPLFTERTFGICDGTLRTDFFAHHQYQDFDTVENTETIEHVQQRAQQALDYIKTIDADIVLVVGHSVFGRAFRRVVQGQPYTDEYGDNPQIKNAEILELI